MSAFGESIFYNFERILSNRSECGYKLIILIFGFAYCWTL